MSKLVTVFGATGNQGNSLVKALLRDKQYIVRAVTRQPDQEPGLALKALGPNVQVFHGDCENKQHCMKAVAGASAVFFSPYALFRHQEYDQGVNVLSAVSAMRTPHLVFGGSDPFFKEHGLDTEIGTYKEKLETDMDNMSIPNTKLRPSFYYQEVLGRFRPVREKMPAQGEPTSWAVNIPAEGKQFPMMSVSHIGNAVKSIVDNPEQYIGKTVGLAGGLFHTQDIVDALNKHCKPYTFYDGHETVEDHRRLEYPEVYENAYTFEYYQLMTFKRDLELTRTLDPNTPSFEQWLQENKAAMLKVLDYEAAIPDHFQQHKGPKPEFETKIDKGFFRSLLD